MKKFEYYGSGTLSFTHLKQDFIIHGVGPHELPEENELVASLVAQKLLIELKEEKIPTNKLKK